MCGIVAAVGNVDIPLCREMLGRIKHRGPDDTGEIQSGDVWLGHQRLSIVDVDGGHQPMMTASGAAVVVNGEIYNHRQIRAELGSELFVTDSDSEAALRAVIIDGPAGLTRLRGMFALAFVDGAGNFLAARDPLGIKPLYWARRDDVTLFASELRAFDPADRPAVRSFPPGCCWSPTGGLVRFAHAVAVDVRPARRSAADEDTLLESIRDT